MLGTAQVLIVEDDENIRYLAGRCLRPMGFEVIEAWDGADALRKMDEHPQCRYMVTDFVMPGLGGDDWIRLLEQRCHDWTIAVVSSEDIDPGPFIYVPKPVDFARLVSLFARERRGA